GHQGGDLRAARPGPRDLPGDPDRPRPGPGAVGAGGPRLGARRGERRPSGASSGGRGEHRLLHRGGVAVEHHQVRPRDPRDGAGGARGPLGGRRGDRQRGRRRGRPPGRRAGGPGRPGRDDRRDAPRGQPARRAHDRPRRSALHVVALRQEVRAGSPEAARRRPARPDNGWMRVVIAEDSVLLREGLVRLLEDAGIETAATVGDGPGLLGVVEEHEPDLAIVDVRMPPSFTDEGLRAALAVRERRPGTPILVLSQYVEERYATDLIGGGAEGVGYLLKERVSDVAEFIDAVRRIAAGGTVIDPEVIGQLLGRRRNDDPLDALTPREREVLALMAQGRSNAAIAEDLVVTEGAVEKHISNIFMKLNLQLAQGGHRRVMAVLTYLGRDVG